MVLGIYHGGCIDGTTAAAVLLKRFPDAKLFPLSHSHTTEELEEVLKDVTNNTQMYILDCAIGIERLLGTCALSVIDHHISNVEKMRAIEKEYPDVEYVFDNNKSGSSLAWSYFFPNDPLPEMISYVEDGDLWRGTFGRETSYVTSYLSMFRDDPAKMLELMEGGVESIKQNGRVITEYADHAIDDLVETKPITVRIGEHEVLAYNIGSYRSACGNILSEQAGATVCTFVIEGDRVNMSFRSKPGQRPTSLELAELLGGGGHEKAAGADIAFLDFLNMIVV